MARILDLTSEVGAYGAKLLAEMGHDVIRVEPPSGDALRRLAPFLGDAPDLESSAFHQYWNAGKRSFAADLGTEEGRRLLLALVGKSDAVVASLPLPLEEAALFEANPNLLLVRLDDGPGELLAYARSGLMGITGDPEGSPLLMGGHIPLSAVGTYLAIATASALFVRRRTGKGQAVDVSAQQCLSGLCEQAMVEYVSAGEVMQRRGPRGGITAVAGALPCADGHWMISAPPSKDGWENFLKMVRHPALLADPSLSQEAMRKEKKDFILDTVAEWSTPFKRDELVEQAQGHHIPASPVTTPLDLIDDPQLRARGFLRDVEHPLFGKVSFPIGALAALWRRTPSTAPRLGEHNAEIARELGA
jgi:formyl-CoA transferase